MSHSIPLTFVRRALLRPEGRRLDGQSVGQCENPSSGHHKQKGKEEGVADQSCETRVTEGDAR